MRRTRLAVAATLAFIPIGGPRIEAMAAVQKTCVKAPCPAWTAIGAAKIIGNGITDIKITARKPRAAAKE